MGNRKHKCKDDKCPCFDCYECYKRLTLQCKIKHHQNTSDCRLFLKPEKKTRDLLGRLWVPEHRESEGGVEVEAPATDAGQKGGVTSKLLQ